MTTTDIRLPSEAALRTASADDITAITGADAPTLERARATFNAIAATSSLDMRRRLLEAAADRAGVSELRRAAGALAKSDTGVSDITELLDIDGIGPRRFVAAIDGLRSVDRDTLEADVIAGELFSRLPVGTPDRRGVALVRSILDGNVEELFDETTPGLELVRNVVADPSVIDGAGFDVAGLATTIEALSVYVAPAFVELLAAGDPVVFGDPPVKTTDPYDDGTGDDDVFGTPPVLPWDDRYLAGQETLVRPPDCPTITVDLPIYRSPKVTLGRVAGSNRIPAALMRVKKTAIALYVELEAAAADALVPDTIAGMPNPMKDSLDLLVQVFLVGAARAKLPAGVPPFDPNREATTASVAAATAAFEAAFKSLAALAISPVDAVVTSGALSRNSIDISGDPGATIVADFSTKMLSTYTFGVEQGTYTTFGQSDRPWFAKGRKPAFRDGSSSDPAKTVLFGENGPATDKEVYPLTIPDTGKLTFPLGVNGNYGLLRLVIGGSDDDACPLTVAPLLSVRGPFEGEVEKEAKGIHKAFGDLIAMHRKDVSAVAAVLDAMQSAAGILSVPGAIVGFAIDLLEKTYVAAGNAFLDRLAQANDEQLRLNLLAAEKLPQSTPVGGAEPIVPLVK